jgi:pyrimidine-nucleoside phosphorylase
MTRAVELIERKRDGAELDDGELSELVLGYARGEVPDEQMAAFAMAVFFRGLSPAETHALTDAMVQSGAVVDLSPIGRICVDKHSTGGVGDKTSIALGPVVAACGVPFAKMSGRGLGHTGGTLDKLESIPGFTVELEAEAFVRQVGEVGLAIVGQTPDLVPADQRLYALRDVTATVEEVSLIAASIMSKKIAAGAGAILLDVKVGEGAFMKTPERARLLAETMLDLGQRAGRRIVCELTAMDEPLGRAVGNALEVREALAALRGEGPPDFTELVLGSAGRLLAMSDLDVDEGEGRRRAEAAVATGEALAIYHRWISAQGGDPDEARLPWAPVVAPVAAPSSGYVVALHGLGVGRAAVRLGAGRSRKEDPVDHATGVVCRAKSGDRVRAGEPLAEVHARNQGDAERAAVEVAACYEVGPEPPSPAPLVLEVIE